MDWLGWFLLTFFGNLMLTLLVTWQRRYANDDGPVLRFNKFVGWGLFLAAVVVRVVIDIFSIPLSHAGQAVQITAVTGVSAYALIWAASNLSLFLTLHRSIARVFGEPETPSAP